MNSRSTSISGKMTDKAWDATARAGESSGEQKRSRKLVGKWEDTDETVPNMSHYSAKINHLGIFSPSMLGVN